MIRKQVIFIICLAMLLAPNLWAAQQTIIIGETFGTSFGKSNANDTEQYAHMASTSNPHTVTPTQLTLVIGTDTQAWDADLDIYAGITPSANIQTFLGAADYAAMITQLGLTIGTDTQAWDAFLDDIGALTDPGADRILFWDDSGTLIDFLILGTNLSITDKTLNATGSGGTTVDALGDATAAGAVDFATYLQQWDVGTAGFQIGDGGSNYAAFDVTGNISFGGTGGLTGNIVSDYITFTPSATTPATTDGLLRNVTGLTGLGDTFGFWDGTAAQYLLNYIPASLTGGDLLIYNVTSDLWANVSVTGAVTIDEDGVSSLTQSAMVVNTIGNFTTPITTAPYTFTAANLYNSTLFYGATGEIDMAAGVDGMATIIYNTGAFTITIDPNGSEVIVRDGTAQTGGVSMTLSSGAGNFVALVFNGTQWVTMGFKGTLAEGT